MKKLAIAAVTLAALGAAMAAHAAPPAASTPVATVSGKWTIVVHSHTGRLRSRTRFENSLVGANVIAKLLAGQATPGQWSIELTEAIAGSGSIPPLAVTASATSWLGKSADGWPANLVATAHVGVAGTITASQTRVAVCKSDVSPAACAQDTSATPAPFTKKTGLSIHVVKGDTVAIGVALTFSGNSLGGSATHQALAQLILGYTVVSYWAVYAINGGAGAGETFFDRTASTAVPSGNTLVQTLVHLPTSGALSFDRLQANFFTCAFSLTDRTTSLPGCGGSQGNGSPVTVVHPLGSSTAAAAGQPFVATWTLTFG